MNTIGHCNSLTCEVLDNGMETARLVFKWDDPEKEGVPYGGTVLVIKENSYPRSYNDGIILVDTMFKNQYKTDGYVYNVPPGTHKYYATLFPYSCAKVFNKFKTQKIEIGEVISTRIQKFREISRIGVSGDTIAKGSTNLKGTVVNNNYRFAKLGTNAQSVKIINIYDMDLDTGNISTSFVIDNGLNINNFSEYNSVADPFVYNNKMYIVVGYVTSNGFSQMCILRYKNNTWTCIKEVICNKPKANVNTGKFYMYNNELYMICTTKVASTAESLTFYKMAIENGDETFNEMIYTGAAMNDMLGFMSLNGTISKFTASNSKLRRQEFNNIEGNTVSSAISTTYSNIPVTGSYAFIEYNDMLFIIIDKMIYRADMENDKSILAKETQLSNFSPATNFIFQKGDKLIHIEDMGSSIMQMVTYEYS